MTMGLEEKILFRASLNNRSGIQPQDSSNSSYALGILYIFSYLESKGHDVRTVLTNEDSFSVSKDKINRAISEEMPDYIGIQILTQTRTNVFRMIEYLHDNYPNIKLIVGGIHATIMYDQIIRKYPHVVVTIGEGEITFSEIIDSSSMPDGVAYWDGVDVIKTPNRKLIKNLDELPFPSHKHAIDTKNEKRISANVISSRGCYSSCSFCCPNPNEKKIIRFRSIKNVVDEIEYIITEFPQITTISFIDDSFTAKNNRVIELCKEIISRKLNNLNYTCAARFKPLREEMITYMEMAGFKSISFGLESGNEEILTRCHKNIKQKDMINALNILKHSSIEYNVYLIVGLPGETNKTIAESAKLIQKLQRIKYSIITNTTILAVYPGTEIYEIMKSAKLIDDSYWMTDGATPIYDKENSFDDLLLMKERLLDKISLLPITPVRIINQLPNSYSILKYLIMKIKRKFGD